MEMSAHPRSWCINVAAVYVMGFCVTTSGDLYAQSQAGGGDLVSTLITFRDVPGPREQTLVSDLGGRIKYTYDLVPTIAAWVPEQAVAVLAADASVLRVEPDVRIRAFDAELTSAWGVSHIGAGAAHASGNKGAGVRVGIIDSGIDYTHPDLSPNYAGGWDFINNDGDPRDDYGHGTMVAGIVGAADNGTGVVGVAPGASLYAYKVFDDSGNGSYSDVIAALNRAIADGIQVVNMSFGSLQNPGDAFRDACNNAAAAGLLLVAAAGNFGTFDGTGDTIAYPGHYSSVIAVGATMSVDDERAFFSGTGPDLDLMAPGFGIYTTDLFGGYAYETGTSMAAPHVTGVAALLLHKGIADVYNELISTGIDLGPEGFDPLYGYGLVNGAAAVMAVPAPSALGLALAGVLLIRKRRPYRSATAEPASDGKA